MLLTNTAVVYGVHSLSEKDWIDETHEQIDTNPPHSQPTTELVAIINLQCKIKIAFYLFMSTTLFLLFMQREDKKIW